MTKLVPASHRVLARILGRLGFVLVRQKGSHAIWEHPDGRMTVVPVHPGEKIGKGLLAKILDDIEITVDEFDGLR